jgi:hypothetical protein
VFTMKTPSISLLISIVSLLVPSAV